MLDVNVWFPYLRKLKRIPESEQPLVSFCARLPDPFEEISSGSNWKILCHTHGCMI
jgi:hypothetical protein